MLVYYWLASVLKKICICKVFLFFCLSSGKTIIICDTWAALCIYTVGISNNKQNVKLLLLGTVKSFTYLVAVSGGVTPIHPQCTARLSRTKANTEHAIVWKISETEYLGFCSHEYKSKQACEKQITFVLGCTDYYGLWITESFQSQVSWEGRHQVTFWCRSPRENNSSCCRATASTWRQGLCVFSVHCVTCTV